MPGRGGGKKRAVTGAWTAALMLASSLFGVACAGTYDTGGFPEASFVQESLLVREWKAGDSSIGLEAAGKFSSASLRLEYFSCSSNGVREKSGSGTWESSAGEQRTEVFLKFDDGCSATLWAGKSGDRTVLWGQLGDSGIVILR